MGMFAGDRRILVIDPDDVQSRLLSVLFSDTGDEVVAVHSPAEVLEEAFGAGADAILMEVDCADGDGIALCARLRHRGYRGPVIFVSARHDVADKIRAFQAGADDYVDKPFDPRELVARVAAVSRRIRDAEHLALGREIRAGEAVLAPGEGLFRFGEGRPIFLTPTESRLLGCLMRDCGVTISRDTLAERAWPHSFMNDTSRVDVVVARLRKKIERDPSAPELIHTTRGFGYTFRHHPRPRLAGAADAPAGADPVAAAASLAGA